MSLAIVWLRRDLRTSDQPALHTAARAHERVLPVYIHAPDEEAPWSPGAASRWWLHHSLTALAARLAKLGSPLLVREGASLATLRALLKETGAAAVYWNRLYEPAALARDAKVEAALVKDGLKVETFNGALLFEPTALATKAGKPYRVYTPMFKAGAARFDELRALLPAPKKLRGPDKPPKSVAIDALQLLPNIAWDAGFSKRWQPGETGALKRLDAFADQALARYQRARDQPAETLGVSALSPHLHFGELSPNQVLLRIRQAEGELQGAGAHASVQQFVKELFWREFSHHLLFHFPHTTTEPLAPKFAQLAWRKPRDYANDLKAWQRGATGIPIVDAGLRELWVSGVMHNRVRMIAASFLTKNLLIPWQEGAAWFWDTLVDADLAQNTLGWQWVAGSGADASPYFRIFNPVLQGEKFDGEGAYVRRWVPELSKLPKRWLHKPWQAPAETLRAAGIAADSVYATPIADLAETRERALAVYRALRTA